MNCPESLSLLLDIVTWTWLVYGNEEEIGKALKQAFDEGIVTREELFITGKHARTKAFLLRGRHCSARQIKWGTAAEKRTLRREISRTQQLHRHPRHTPPPPTPYTPHHGP